MAKARLLSTTLSTSEKYFALYAEAGDLAEFCQSLFPLIVAHADDFGRLQGDSFTVKMRVLPISPRSIDEFGHALTALHNVGLVQVYTVEGHSYVQVVDFDKHQTGLKKRTRSRFPEIPENSGNSRKFPLNRTEQNRTEGTEQRERFDRFIAAYPPVGGDVEAWGEWQGMDPSEGAAGEIIAGAGRYAVFVAAVGRDPNYVKTPANFLRQSLWMETWTIPKAKAKRTTEPVGGSTNCPHSPRCTSTKACIALYLQQQKAAQAKEASV